VPPPDGLPEDDKTRSHHTAGQCSRNAASVRAGKEGDDYKDDEVEGIKEVDLLRGHGFTQPHDVNRPRGPRCHDLTARREPPVMYAMVTDWPGPRTADITPFALAAYGEEMQRDFAAHDEAVRPDARRHHAQRHHARRVFFLH